MSVLSTLDDLLSVTAHPILLAPTQRKQLVGEIAATGSGALVGEPLLVTERWYNGECVDFAGNSVLVNNAQVLGSYAGRLLLEDLFGDLRTVEEN